MLFASDRIGPRYRCMFYVSVASASLRSFLDSPRCGDPLIAFLPKNEEDTIQELHASQARIQALRIHLNTFQRINRLPPEILSHIFLDATECLAEPFFGKELALL